MSIAFVRVNGGTVGSSGTSVALTGQTTTNGDTCFVSVLGDQPCSSLTTNGTSSVTLIKSTSSGSQFGSLYRVDITSGVTSFTANLGGTTAGTHVDVIEFSGIVSNDLNAATAGPSATVQSSTLTPTQSNSLFLFASINANFANGSYSNSWSNWTSPGDLGNAYKIQSGGPSSDSTSFPLFGSAAWIGITATFGPSAANTQNAPAGLASFAFSALSAYSAHAGVATFTFSALTPGVNADVARFSFQAFDATTSHFWAAAFSLFAQDAKTITAPNAGATFTFAALDPGRTLAARIGFASFSMAAFGATISTDAGLHNASPDVARFSFTALTPSTAALAPIGFATFTIGPSSPKVELGPSPAVATVTFAALSPTISHGVVTFVAWHFTPPTETTVSNVAYDAPNPLGNRLMSFFPLRKRGRAVWHLADDTISFDQPIPTVFPESAARGDLFLNPLDSNLTHVTVKNVYYGGSTYTIDDVEAARISAFLTANNYNPADWLELV